MPTNSSASVRTVTSKPYLVWRVLILGFCFAAGLTLAQSILQVLRGGAVEMVQIVFSFGFLGLGAWLYPQTVTVDENGVEQIRCFGLIRTRIAVENIDFYWDTNREAIKDYLGKGNLDDQRDRAVAQRQAAVLIKSSIEQKPIVLSHYHADRAAVVDELKRMGVRSYESIVQTLKG